MKLTRQMLFGKALRGKAVHLLVSSVHPSAAQAVRSSGGADGVLYVPLCSHTLSADLLAGHWHITKQRIDLTRKPAQMSLLAPHSQDDGITSGLQTGAVKATWKH